MMVLGVHAPDSQVMAETAGTKHGGADAAPCFLERLSEAMLHWGWRLAAEIENSHLIYIYI